MLTAVRETVSFALSSNKESILPLPGDSEILFAPCGLSSTKSIVVWFFTAPAGIFRVTLPLGDLISVSLSGPTAAEVVWKSGVADALLFVKRKCLIGFSISRYISVDTECHIFSVVRITLPVTLPKSICFWAMFCGEIERTVARTTVTQMLLNNLFLGRISELLLFMNSCRKQRTNAF